MEIEDTDRANLETQIAPVVSKATSMVVANKADFDAAIAFTAEVKGSAKRVRDFFAPLKQAAAEAHKRIVAAEKKFLDPLENAEDTLKRICLDWRTSEEKKRREEERRLQAEADERARKEREKLEKRAASVKTEEKKAELLERAAEIAAPVIAIPVQAVSEGSSFRKVWKARIVDEKAVPREWMVVNEKAIQAHARNTKGSVAIPGVEFYAEESLAVTSSKGGF